ncbi:nucleoside transporter, partial [Salmonella enterica]|nr:nucleoside transporter [Salmonella enterica]
VHGGDIAFTCRGWLTPPGLTLEVRQYNRDIPSTLGMEGDYVLEMQYRETGEGEYHFSGHVRGYPERRLKAHALFLTPLLE